MREKREFENISNKWIEQTEIMEVKAQNRLVDGI